MGGFSYEQTLYVIGPYFMLYFMPLTRQLKVVPARISGYLLQNSLVVHAGLSPNVKLKLILKTPLLRVGLQKFVYLKNK